MTILSSSVGVVGAESDLSSAKFDFKQFMWGDKRETIIAIEGDAHTEEKMEARDVTFLAYPARAVGLDVALAYYFCEQGLYSVRYVLIEEHSNENLYIDDYEVFKSALIEKYGDPVVDTEDWSDSSKKNYYLSRKGDALVYGHLAYSTVFITERSLIMMSMSADNYRVSTTIDYSSMKISPDDANYDDEI